MAKHSGGKHAARNKAAPVARGHSLVGRYLSLSLVVLAALVAALAWLGNLRSGSASVATSGGVQVSPSNETEDGEFGPDEMASEAGLVKRLLELLREVDGLRGEDQQAQRREASKHVEKELGEIEKLLDVSTAAGKQQSGLVALVRSALRSDSDPGAAEEEWSEDALLDRYGLVTYASPEYWEKNYAHRKYGDSFDWYSSWDQPDVSGIALRDVLLGIVPTSGRVLILGCGNSNMSALMHKDGYRDITNIDISEAVIGQMRKKYEHLAGMTWQSMDASAMDFGDEAFDSVIEKGVFDALYAGTGSKVLNVLSEVQRVLRPGGLLVSISFAADRLSRLFAHNQEENQPVVANSAEPLSCRETRTLQYARGANNSSQDFWVYTCDKHRLNDSQK